MAKYRLKRRYYGVIADAAQNTLGGVTTGVGKALDNKVAGVAGGLYAMNEVGGKIGEAIGGPLGGLAGHALGYIAGSAVTRGVGKGLKSAGQDIQMGV